jgi:hypothetical protein
MGKCPIESLIQGPLTFLLLDYGQELVLPAFSTNQGFLQKHRRKRFRSTVLILLFQTIDSKSALK